MSIVSQTGKGMEYNPFKQRFEQDVIHVYAIAYLS